MEVSQKKTSKFDHVYYRTYGFGDPLFSETSKKNQKPPAEEEPLRSIWASAEFTTSSLRAVRGNVQLD